MAVPGESRRRAGLITKVIAMDGEIVGFALMVMLGIAVLAGLVIGGGIVGLIVWYFKK